MRAGHLLLLIAASISAASSAGPPRPRAFHRSDGSTINGAKRRHGDNRALTRDVRRDVTVFGGNEENALTGAEDTTYFSVVLVSLMNASINAVRPDPAIVWQARVPRVLWELCISIVASSASSSSRRRPIPALHLLLAFMTGSTALIDAFLWAPVFALTASFESCTGGGWFDSQPKVCVTDYVKGAGRLLVSVQCVLTAVFYLATAITAWGDFLSVRDRQVAERQAEAFRGVLHATAEMQGSDARGVNHVYS